MRKKAHDVLRQLDAHGCCLLFQDGLTDFHVRRLKIGDQSPLETRNQAMFQALNLARRPVASQHDLFVRFVQCVERMKKFFLDTLLASEELDVVNQQHIRLPIFFAELGERVVLDRINVFVRELLGGHVTDTRPFFGRNHMLANGVKQVRLAKTDTTVEKQWVIGFPRSISNGFGGRSREVVVISDDERIECVLGIEAPLAGSWKTLLSRCSRGFDFGSRLGFFGGCRCSKRAVTVCDQELRPELTRTSSAENVLQQTLIIILQPHFAEIIRDFEHHKIAFKPGGSQRRKPKIESVRAQHRAKLFLRGTPDFLC